MCPSINAIRYALVVLETSKLELMKELIRADFYGNQKLVDHVRLHHHDLQQVTAFLNQQLKLRKGKR